MPTHNRTHGMWNTKLYRTLTHILHRCYDPKDLSYVNYGARGITVCDRWRFGENGKTGVECFAEDVGEPPSDSHSIDRYPNNDGNYEPGNVRWASKVDQQNNKRTSRFLVIGGISQTAAQWAAQTGIKSATIRARAAAGFSEQDLIGPVKTGRGWKCAR